MASRGVGGGGVCKHVSLTTVKLAAKYIQKLKRGQHWIDIYKFFYDDSKKMQNQMSHVFQMLEIEHISTILVFPVSKVTRLTLYILHQHTYSPHCSLNQGLLTILIISFILMTSMFDSGMIL